MSLIVQVNNNSGAPPGGGGGGGPPPTPAGAAAVTTQQQQIVSASTGPITLSKPPSNVAVAIAAATAGKFSLEQHHIVQRHPPPLDGRLRMPSNISLPQNPIRQLPQTPIRHHQLPQSPIRHHQLPQTPISLPGHLHRAVRKPQPNSTNHCIISPRPMSAAATAAHHISMLPQTPTPGIMPILPTTAGLIPIPRMQLQAHHFSPSPLPSQQPSTTTSTILPPNTLHQLFASGGPHVDSADELDVTDTSEVAPSNNQHRNKRLSSPRSRHVGKPLQLALQDHNYATRPPPTPPPPPPPPPPVIPPAPKSPPLIVTDQKASSFNLPEFMTNTTPAPTVPSKIQANLNSIQEAGVGHMVPLLVDDNAQDGHSSDSSHNDDKGGEETETAPEAEAEDDSITRCICDYLHDDGYMICCDKCSVWQHVVCMGLDRNNIPDEYLCEVCKPRPIDRKRAKALQTRRRNELFTNNSSSSDDENKGGKKSKKMLDKKDSKSSNNLNLKKKFKKTFNEGNKSVQKKQYRKRKQSEKQESSTAPHNRSAGKSRRKSQSSAIIDEDEDDDEDDDLEPKLDASQQLRSWIDQYEEAVTNHYSPELRARLSSNKPSNGDLRSGAIGGPTRCTVSLQGNGVKILTASSNLSSNTPVIECKGKVMSAAQYRSTNKGLSANPYVLFYKLGDSLEICVDGKTYGNDSRFCRRSSNYNAELKHVLDKGSLHIFIVTSKSIEKYQEILLPPETKATPLENNGMLSSSIHDDVREIRNKPNGNLTSSPDDSPPPPPANPKRKKRAISERNKKLNNKKSNNKQTNGPPSGRKTRGQVMKEEEELEDEVDDDIISSPKVNGDHEDEKPLMVAPPPEGLLEDDDESSPSQQASPTKANVKSSPGKLGLPDSSGLIVGVNTINYDASLRNKAKSREERKMEMIMKAIEQMEKAEQRKKDVTDPTDRPGKRRRSNSSKNANADSNLDASSADESKPIDNKRFKKKGRKGNPSVGPNTPQRRRSRVMSGGSADETPPSTENQFRFPKTKKMIVSDWLSQEDDVSGSYLRGSRSPPGIATHLLRSAPISPVKNVCSAKKRWLRQAISEDHSEPPTINGGNDVVSTVTPLKKRRLANYKEEEEAESNEKSTIESAMEELMGNESSATNSPATATTTGNTDVKPEVKVEDEVIKTPEPSSVFKSFFKSNVSLEKLEAELEESKRQREQQQSSNDDVFVAKGGEEDEDVKTPQAAPLTNNEDVKEESSDLKPKEKRRVSLADYKRRRGKPSESASDSAAPTTRKTTSSPPPQPARTAVVEPPKREATPPPSSLPMPTTKIEDEDEPGTPTLDEDRPVIMPTLNTLPLFEKLNQLEKAHKENSSKKKVVQTTSVLDNLPSSNSNDVDNLPPPVVEPKREDLTERLKKEFGLVVEDGNSRSSAPVPPPSSVPAAVDNNKVDNMDLEEDGDATPETGSPLPDVSKPPPPIANRFTPTQYPSYPSNYPIPPYPASKTAAAPHPPPHHHGSSTVTSSSLHSSSRKSDYYGSSSSSGNRGYYTSSSSRDSRYRDRDHRNDRDYRDRDRDRDHHHHHHHRGSRHYNRNYYT